VVVPGCELNRRRPAPDTRSAKPAHPFRRKGLIAEHVLLRAEHHDGELVGVARRERMIVGTVDERRCESPEMTVRAGDVARNGDVSASRPSWRDGREPRMTDRRRAPRTGRRDSLDGARPARPRAPSVYGGVLTAAQDSASELGWSWEALSWWRREGDGWTVAMDVVDTRRVPSTTDVMAVYDVDFDDAGELLGYRRLRHDARGRGDNERYA
jgi:hypothetical protein